MPAWVIDPLCVLLPPHDGQRHQESTKRYVGIPFPVHCRTHAGLLSTINKQIKTPMKIDIARCTKAMQFLAISGVPRPELIEKAIALIQKNPDDALRSGYLGIKNYAHFGDQRCDCPYGMGPKHGDIVFSIGRTRNCLRHDALAVSDDEIYYLQCYRDFGSISEKTNNIYDRVLTLCDVLMELKTITERRDVLMKHIDEANVELVEAPANP
jgi:hypothetical protein